MNHLHSAWTVNDGRQRALSLFSEIYGSQPQGVWSSPGRVNLIGEHTDYNGGLCLPMALPHRTYVAATPRTDSVVRIASNFGDDDEDLRTVTWEGTVADIAPGNVTGWVAYCGGPIWALRENGIDVPGLDLAIVSCVPLGAGLSSSAAVECAVGLAAAELGGHPLNGSDEDRAFLANLCVRAENVVVGAPTGGMDQAASLRTAEGHAILLDCRSGHVTQVPFDVAADGLELLVADTRASHSLTDGQYGKRRASCEEAATLLGVETLREVADADNPQDYLDRLDDDILLRRSRHVVTEIKRVREFRDAIESRDWETAGILMRASHDSLRDDYEVSCIELDTVVEAATAAGAIGARMTGGGFGGSAIALVRVDQASVVVEKIIAAAKERGLPTPQIHQAVPSRAGERL